MNLYEYKLNSLNNSLYISINANSIRLHISSAVLEKKHFEGHCIPITRLFSLSVVRDNKIPIVSAS
jgi:hypothetical protein